MSEDAPGYDAYVCHPQFGPEMVHGRMRVAWDLLRFEWDGDPVQLRPDQVLVRLGNDENFLELIDRQDPARKFFVAREILEDERFLLLQPIRRQLERIAGRADLWRRLRLTFAGLLGFALIAWLAGAAMNWGIACVVRGVPADREIAFGQEAYQKVAADSVFVNDSNAVAQVAAIAAPLRAVVDTHGVPFHYYLIEGEPNAFALPGGHIFVTTGLLNLLDSPEELAGVLAHESAHVARRHMFQHLISGEGPIYLIQLLTGGRNQLFNLMAFPSELLVYESYSQKYEREADSYGWDYLLAAGIDPRGLSRALTKLRNYEGGESSPHHGKAFASHPELDQRIAWLDAKWNALPADRRVQFTPITTPLPKIKTEQHRSVLEKLFGH